MKVLVVKLSSLGDVIHTLPAVGDAATAVPGIRFDWVVEEAFAEIPSWHPAVERVIPVALRRWRRQPLRALRSGELQRARQQLRSIRYDAVIDAQGLLKSAAVASQVGAPCSGMGWRSAREGLAATAYRHRFHIPRDLHAVARVRRLFAAALGYACPDTAPDFGLRQSLSPVSRDAAQFLLFLHGTSYAAKEWPEHYWRALALLATQAGFDVVLPHGDALEEARARRIAAGVSAVRVLPRLTLTELAGRLLTCAGAVAVDTGLGHLAAALAVPAVSLYGPTRPERVGTCGDHQAHMLAPLGPGNSNRRRMASIEPAMVWAQLAAMLPGATVTRAAGASTH